MPKFDHSVVIKTVLIVGMFCQQPALAEDGYDLWLRYKLIDNPSLKETYKNHLTCLCNFCTASTGKAISAELVRGINGMLGVNLGNAKGIDKDGELIVVSAHSKPFKELGLEQNLEKELKQDLANLGKEGYIIRSLKYNGHPITVIASNTDIGAFYGAFHFLRLLQTEQTIDALAISEKPRLTLRLLNHWDNLDGTIERGYAGQSLWYNQRSPGEMNKRLIDYARANASIGINGTVLNNVNASPDVLTETQLRKAAAVASLIRPYGMRVYLSANFGAPKSIGGLSTADPLDPQVVAWWHRRVALIYRLIPDFGGFLVKANSEGSPGPQDYGRTHVEGANMLAKALKPFGGIVMWRAFVYTQDMEDPDRVKRSYQAFQPLDGQFDDNVLLQVKNGPLDFQPREPFHPLFGSLKKTNIIAELEIAQEYLGQSTHLVYLGPMWKEFLNASTYAVKDKESPVWSILEGAAQNSRPTGIAAVANTGDNRNWCGHDFAQANWYALGRLAWNPELGADEIAREWLKATWTCAPQAVNTILGMMLESHEAYVNYTMPLGLHHLVGGDHYAPMLKENVNFHHADANGIGYDRTRSGSDYVDQYNKPLSDQFNDLKVCPVKLLLWFHNVPWDYKLKSGFSLWAELCKHFDNGVEQTSGFVKQWHSVSPGIDPERFRAVSRKLETQAHDAQRWRDFELDYFQKKSGRPLQ